MHYVYILYSAKLDRFYIGESVDPDRRLEFHRSGTERYSARTEDWTLVFKKAFPSRTAALSVEKKIKASKNRKTIQRWINGKDNELIP